MFACLLFQSCACVNLFLHDVGAATDDDDDDLMQI